MRRAQTCEGYHRTASQTHQNIGARRGAEANPMISEWSPQGVRVSIW